MVSRAHVSSGKQPTQRFRIRLQAQCIAGVELELGGTHLLSRMKRYSALAVAPLNRLIAAVQWRLATACGVMHGIDVAVEITDDGDASSDSKVILSRLRAGLDLIEQAVPHRLARVRRDIRRLLVFTLPGHWGLFHQHTATIIVARHFLESSAATPLAVATVLIHEATHAELAARGIPYQGNTRVRHEKACLRAELRFLARLQPSDERDRLRATVADDLANADVKWQATVHLARLSQMSTDLNLAGPVRAVLSHLGGWFHRA